MLEKIRFLRTDHTDLNMYQCGMEDCSPGHSWGPAVRDHFLVHYIVNGKGTFHVGNNIYYLQKNQGFLICPGIVASYQADHDEPWSYSWAGFHGLKAEQYLKQANLTAETPIFNYDRDDFVKNCFNEMINTKQLIKTREIRLLSLLYAFLSQLIESNGDMHTDKSTNRKELYIKKAVEYIEMNYASKISVSEMAHYIGLDRSYLFSLFKEYLNTSPQDYIINYRMNKAVELMNHNILSIGDIARSVGYDDPLLFSKVFKRSKGTGPREFRKKL